jgi:hypothetical protein
MVSGVPDASSAQDVALRACAERGVSRMETCLWASDGPWQSVVVVRSPVALLKPEDVKGRAPSGHASTMPNQGSKSHER